MNVADQRRASKRLEKAAALREVLASKWCTWGGEWLPVTEFPENASLKSRKSSWCRPCLRAVTRRWRAEHREEEKAARREGLFPATCQEGHQEFQGGAEGAGSLVRPASRCGAGHGSGGSRDRDRDRDPNT